jgi:hypothetical protein
MLGTDLKFTLRKEKEKEKWKEKAHIYKKPTKSPIH